MALKGSTSSSPTTVPAVPIPQMFTTIPPDNSSEGDFGGDVLPDADTQTAEQIESSVADSLPAFIIGFATSIALCALYRLQSELRKRRRKREGHGNPHLHSVAIDSNQVQADATSSSIADRAWRSVTESRNCSSGESGRESSPGRESFPGNAANGESRESPFFCPNQSSHCEESEHGRPQDLRPRRLQSDYPAYLFDDMSLSPVSTMTASVGFESPTSNESNTELSASNRVSRDIKLRSLVSLSQISVMAMASSSTTSTTVSSSGVFRKRSAMDEDTPQNAPCSKTAVAATIMVSPSFDAAIQSAASPVLVMNDHDDEGDAVCPKDGHSYNGVVDVSLSEEDESGWTSSAGKSDSSSDVSIGTYLKSISSAKSRTSKRSQDSKSSEILGEECLTPKLPRSTKVNRTPEKPKLYAVLQSRNEAREQRQGGDSLDLSPELSISNESRTPNADSESADPIEIGSSMDKSENQESHPFANELAQLEQIYINEEIPEQYCIAADIHSNTAYNISACLIHRGSFDQEDACNDACLEPAGVGYHCVPDIESSMAQSMNHKDGSFSSRSLDLEVEASNGSAYRQSHLREIFVLPMTEVQANLDLEIQTTLSMQ